MSKHSAAELERLAIRIFRASGASLSNARIVGRHLVQANRAGHDSHGVLRIPQYVEAARTHRLNPDAAPKVVRQSACIALVDGRRGFGQVAAQKAVTLAIRKAKQNGVAAVTCFNSYHSGRIGSYTQQIAAEGLVALAMVNAGGGGQSVAPFGGIAARLATNPLSIAVPSSRGFPVVLDIATSVAPEGKLRDYQQKGQPLPRGWLMDAKGRPSTNANDFYAAPRGALLPLGGPAGHKGYGLAFMIDILAGALSGAGCCRKGATEAKDGLLFIAIDARRFAPLKTFHRHLARLIDHVKSCPVAPGFKEVFVPGELEACEEKRRRQHGIEVPTVAWKAIQEIAHELGVALPNG